jgi:hypothetical protein
MSTSSFAQGFDWQYDHRLPSSYPVIFVGINAEYGIIFHQGNFNFLEDEIPCCRFTNGDGNNSNIGISLEYWYSSDVSLMLTASVSNSTGSFSANSSDTIRGGSMKTAFDFESSVSYLAVSPGIKYRLLGSKLYAAFDLKMLIKYASTGEHSERRISNNVPFNSRTIANGRIDALSTLVVLPQLRLGYDMAIFRNVYISPYISASYTINNIIESEKWRHFDLHFGISLMNGLISK